MLKKSFFLFLTFITTISCGKKLTPISLDSKYYNSTAPGFIEVKKYDEVASLIDLRASFGLYFFSESCTICSGFTPILTEYLESAGLVFIKLSYSLTPKTNNIFVTKEIKAPSVILFNQGEFTYHLDNRADKDEAAFESTKELEKWMKARITFPN